MPVLAKEPKNVASSFKAALREPTEINKYKYENGVELYLLELLKKKFL